MISRVVVIAQPVYEHVYHEAAYDYLDELANDGYITLTDVVKPYTRSYIRGKLLSVDSMDLAAMTQRQVADYTFFCRAFHTGRQEGIDARLRYAEIAYHDSMVAFSFRPVMGLDYYSNENGTLLHRRNGAEAFMGIARHFGIYASLRDNYHSGILTNPEFVNQTPGALYKLHGEGGDFSEMRGGVAYENEWLTLAVVKDHITWGTNYHGANIFSAKAPSFAQIKLRLHPVSWFELNYFHAWLVSEVVDSLRSYNYTNAYGINTRYVYHPKYLAANMFTFKPWRGVNLSFGNSIVYSDIGIQPAFLIPVMFFKSVDHTLNGVNNYAGQNSQMFLDFSIRKIKHLHLYSTLFIDEISIKRMFDKEQHSNFISFKVGGRLSNYPVANLSFTAEYTRTNPLVYKHIVPTTTFESNRYNLGHHLMDNAEEFYAGCTFRPFSKGTRLRAHAWYSFSRKGDDYNNEGTFRWGLPFIEHERWRQTEAGISIQWEVFYNASFLISYRYAKTTGDDLSVLTPELFRGKTNTLLATARIGI